MFSLVIGAWEFLVYTLNCKCFVRKDHVLYIMLPLIMSDTVLDAQIYLWVKRFQVKQN